MFVLASEDQDTAPSFHGRRDEGKAVLIIPDGGGCTAVPRQTQHLVGLLVLDVVVEE